MKAELAKWELYSNFKKSEFDCKHTGDNFMLHAFMVTLQNIRAECGFPFTVTSGYRARTHPNERNKSRPGDHGLGCGVDIAVTGYEALRIIEVALKYGIKRIGVQQKGAGRFIHLGMGDRITDYLPATVWSY